MEAKSNSQNQKEGVKETKQPLITKDMTIGDVVKKYPQTAAVFSEYGLHCVGCHVAYWETLEQGAAGHGMPPEVIDKMIEDANEIAEMNYGNEEGNQPTTEGITITAFAAEKLKEHIKSSNRDGYMLRIVIAKGGCSGYSYEFYFDNKTNDEDKVFDQNGVKIVVSNEDLKMINGSKIDYVESLTGAGFKVSNPNAKETCGCGSSFS